MFKKNLFSRLKLNTKIVEILLKLIKIFIKLRTEQLQIKINKEKVVVIVH